MGLVDAVTNNLEGGESEGIYFEADARTLGLRVLVPPEEEEKTSEAAKKTMKEKKEAGTNGKRKGGPDSSNKKDDGDKSFQMIADDRPKAAAIGDNDATIPSILPHRVSNRSMYFRRIVILPWALTILATMPRSCPTSND